MDPNMGPKIPQKSALGRPGPPRDANGRPEGSMEQFWSLLGPIFAPILVPFGGHFCFGPCLNLRSSFGHPGLMFQAVQATGALSVALPFGPLELLFSEALTTTHLSHNASKQGGRRHGGGALKIFSTAA